MQNSAENTGLAI